MKEIKAKKISRKKRREKSFFFASIFFNDFLALEGEGLPVTRPLFDLKNPPQCCRVLFFSRKFPCIPCQANINNIQTSADKRDKSNQDD